MQKPYDAAREALDKAVQELWRAQEFYADLTPEQRTVLLQCRSFAIGAKQELAALMQSVGVQ